MTLLIRPLLLEAGASAAAAMWKIEGVEYSTGSSSQDLYINSGSSKDWAYDAGCDLSYTIELRDTGEYGFLLPPEQIVGSAREFTVGTHRLMDYAIVEFDGGYNGGKGLSVSLLLVFFVKCLLF